MSETKKKFDLKESMYFVRSKVASNPKRSLAAGFVFLVLLAASLVLIFELPSESTETKGKRTEQSYVSSYADRIQLARCLDYFTAN